MFLQNGFKVLTNQRFYLKDADYIYKRYSSNFNPYWPYCDQTVCLYLSILDLFYLLSIYLEGYTLILPLSFLFPSHFPSPPTPPLLERHKESVSITCDNLFFHLLNWSHLMKKLTNDITPSNNPYSLTNLPQHYSIPFPFFFLGVFIAFSVFSQYNLHCFVISGIGDSAPL